MVGEAAQVNALKAIARAVEDQTRVMKDLGHSLAKITKTLTALNENYVQAHRDEESASD